MNRSNTTWAAASAVAVLIAAPLPIARGELFTYSGAVGAGQAWEVDANWLGDGGEVVDTYPGQTVATDSATTSIDLGGAALGVNISTAVGVVTLTLGDTNAVPQATTIGGGGTLNAGTINSAGTAGAVNTIDVDLLSNGTSIGGGNGLTINGDIVVNGGGSKTLRNLVAQTVTLNGPVSLSNGGAAGNLLFRQDNDASVMFLNGVISNGAVPAASSGSVQVRYARGTFHNTVDNTYNGATQLGDNSPNNASTNIIYTDGAFSTGRISFAGGSAIKTVAGAAGFGTRTLANEVQVSRDARFAGPESIVLTGKVFLSNTRSIINDIDAGKSLTLSGPVFTDSGSNVNDQGRTLTFAGSGETVITGTIDDKDGAPAAARGGVRRSGTGRLIFSSPNAVQYAAATEIQGGVVQLGVGGAAVGLNDHSVQGSSTGSSVLEINHSGALSIDASLAYNLTVNHVGSGATNFTASSFGAGDINVDNGDVLINGGLFAGSNIVGLRAPGATGDTSLMNVGSTAGLRKGQPVTATNGPGSIGAVLPPAGDLYILEIVNATTVKLSANFGDDASSGGQWNLAFGAGTGTGAANVNVDAGASVGGSGVIGGSLLADGVVAPGNSVGVLSVLGNSTVNAGFDVEFDGAAAGSIDLLAVSGDLTLGANSILDFAAVGMPADDPSYVFATYGGTLTGTFGSILDLPSGYTVDYAFGGNSIALVQQAVPEPAALCLMAVTLAPLALRRRKR